MLRSILFFLIFFVFTIAIDQYIKFIVLDGFRFDSDYISIVLAFNKGVAFSMLSFLDVYLKYIQICLILIGLYVFIDGNYLKKYAIPAGILFGAGISNIYDRFVQEGVVDYVFWHYGFEFAIFNFADVMIDLAIIIILYLHFKK